MRRLKSRAEIDAPPARRRPLSLTLAAFCSLSPDSPTLMLSTSLATRMPRMGWAVLSSFCGDKKGERRERWSGRRRTGGARVFSRARVPASPVRRHVRAHCTRASLGGGGRGSEGRRRGARRGGGGSGASAAADWERARERAASAPRLSPPASAAAAARATERSAGRGAARGEAAAGIGGGEAPTAHDRGGDAPRGVPLWTAPRSLARTQGAREQSTYRHGGEVGWSWREKGRSGGKENAVCGESLEKHQKTSASLLTLCPLSIFSVARAIGNAAATHRSRMASPPADAGAPSARRASGAPAPPSPTPATRHFHLAVGTPADMMVCD